MEKLKLFEKRKNNILQYIQQTIDIASYLKASNVVDKQQINYKQLSQDQFLLTVVGEFSRGKSMFINSLLGDQILPSKVKPTTAMITSITYAENTQYELHFRNSNEVKQLSQEEFFEMSAPREPDLEDKKDVDRYNKELDYFKEVKLAEVKYPSDLCKLGVQIIDTPGTNDIDTAREEITLSFVPKADAVIVLLSATQPVTSDEVTFIKERILTEHIAKVFIILNRVDLLNPEEQIKTINYTKEKLADFIPNAKIYPMASKDALTVKMINNGKTFKNKKQKFFTLEETGIARFEEDLSYFLEHEKGQVKLKKHVQKLNESIIELQNNTIALRLTALDSEIEEINRKIDEINPQIQQYRDNTKQIISDLVVGLQNAEYPLVNQVESELRNFFNKVIERLDDYSGDLDNANEIRSFMSRRIEIMDKPLKEKIGSLKKEAIDVQLTSAYKKLNTEEKTLNKALYSTFNINIGMTNSLQIQHEEMSADDILGIFAIGAGAGLVGVVVAPALVVLGAIGTVLGGVVFFDEISNFFGNWNRERKLKKVKSALKESFNNEIQNIIVSFKSDWNQLTYEIKNKFMIDVDKKIEAIQNNFYQIRLENEKDKMEREHIKLELQQYQEQLIKIQQVTTELIEEAYV